ncbi:type I methionyl aminopeptidase [Pseudenhygromyxa sp. WMMC2535]|uniref:type I methionyl aminopeptidase n=1 Tax=Pseudenhygromyxa sp. WMMC2535 TaxID=2712867 RepID=UPI001556FF16|nr:type I methionyl aminopeptidase [Pseudenhygromyxa sp. WMMC2535]NVB38839.1 type I methionyl aminopeptidase [Pseudenhygromyxa sp. WMMC2535]
MLAEVKNARELDKMRAACRFAASVLDFIAPHVVPGVTTSELDRLCHEFIVAHGAYPAPLGYRGFPAAVCTSVNEVVCHGVPNQRALVEGDIINIDVTTIVDGWFGDTSETFAIGAIPEEAQRLVDVTREAMWLGIREVAPGKTIGDIGAVIVALARRHGYSVGEAFCGHGIGREMHMPPQVPHVGRRGQGLSLRPGMTFTIEPMLNQGTAEVEILADHWTAVTSDGRLSAQAEHTILVTEAGFEVLTMRESAWRPADLEL